LPAKIIQNSERFTSDFDRGANISGTAGYIQNRRHDIVIDTNSSRSPAIAEKV